MRRPPTGTGARQGWTLLLIAWLQPRALQRRALSCRLSLCEAPRWRSVLPLLSYRSAGDQGGGRRLAAQRTAQFAGTAASLLLRSGAAGNHLLFVPNRRSRCYCDLPRSLVCQVPTDIQFAFMTSERGEVAAITTPQELFVPQLSTQKPPRRRRRRRQGDKEVAPICGPVTNVTVQSTK